MAGDSDGGSMFDDVNEPISIMLRCRQEMLSQAGLETCTPSTTCKKTHVHNLLFYLCIQTSFKKK
jgi:hypothetical protein